MSKDSACWPFIAGLAIGLIIGFMLCADAATENAEEHNAQYHTEKEQ